MNRGATEILQCLNMPQNIGCGIQMKEVETSRDDSMMWQHEQQSVSYINGDDNKMCMFQGLMNIDHGLGYFLSDQELKQEPVFENPWNVFDGNSSVGDISSRGSEFDINYSIPRTFSCPPAVAAAMAEAAVDAWKWKETTSTVGRECFKKRKLEKTRSQKVITEEEGKDKKMKGCAQEGDSKITEQHSNNSKQSEPSVHVSKDNSKVSEVKKPDFIHVRARRGQATDSHSLAERVRREKISERMKFLQDLVPGCNKIVGKAGMLDEIINYVQSLQRQVEFLSMKLATVNHTIDLNIDSFLTKELEMADSANLQFNPLPQVVSCPGIENVTSTPDMALRRTISAPVSLPEALLDQSCFSQIQHSSNWEVNLQNIFAMELEQGKSASMFSQPFSGYIEAGHVKLEI